MTVQDKAKLLAAKVAVQHVVSATPLSSTNTGRYWVGTFVALETNPGLSQVQIGTSVYRNVPRLNSAFITANSNAAAVTSAPVAPGLTALGQASGTSGTAALGNHLHGLTGTSGAQSTGTAHTHGVGSEISDNTDLGTHSHSFAEGVGHQHTGDTAHTHTFTDNSPTFTIPAAGAPLLLLQLGGSFLILGVMTGDPTLATDLGTGG